MAEAKTPKPTLDALLIACDILEDQGLAPTIVGALREAARIRAVVEGWAAADPMTAGSGPTLSLDTGALARKRTAGMILRAAHEGADGRPPTRVEEERIAREEPHLRRQMGLDAPARSLLDRTTELEAELLCGKPREPVSDREALARTNRAMLNLMGISKSDPTSP